MSWITRTLTSSIGKKMLMAASGAFLVLFILIHLIGNGTSLLGRAAFLSYAAHLHSLGPLVSLFEILLLGIFCTHVTLAVLLFLENRRARPHRYAMVTSRGGRSPGSRTMIYSGMVILVFLVVHLLNFHFTSHTAPIADIVRATLSNPGVAIFYIIGVLALGLHVSHGFWSLFQSLGLEHPKFTGGLEKKSVALGLGVGLLFALIPVLALLLPGFLL